VFIFSRFAFAVVALTPLMQHSLVTSTELCRKICWIIDVLNLEGVQIRCQAATQRIKAAPPNAGPLECWFGLISIEVSRGGLASDPIRRPRLPDAPRAKDAGNIQLHFRDRRLRCFPRLQCGGQRCNPRYQRFGALRLRLSYNHSPTLVESDFAADVQHARLFIPVLPLKSKDPTPSQPSKSTHSADRRSTRRKEVQNLSRPALALCSLNRFCY
jgi:hypothetical protein